MNSSESNQESQSLPKSLQRGSLILRLMVIGLVVLGIAGLFGYTAGWLTPNVLTPTKIIDRFEQVNGEHPGFRRNHAKGVCISGYFESNGGGTVLSKAVVFLPGRVPIIGRFALAVGQPYAADAAHTVRSMALLFKLPDGEEWRTGMNNIPVFPVNSAEGFYDLLLFSAPVPATGKPDPAKMDALITKHPEFAKAIQLIHGQPVSSGFADSAYNSLNAFRFFNAKGAETPVRWSMVPVQAFRPFNSAMSNKSNTNQLFDALIAEIHNGALQWHLII